MKSSSSEKKIFWQSSIPNWVKKFKGPAKKNLRESSHGKIYQKVERKNFHIFADVESLLSVSKSKDLKSAEKYLGISHSSSGFPHKLESSRIDSSQTYRYSNRGKKSNYASATVIRKRNDFKDLPSASSTDLSKSVYRQERLKNSSENNSKSSSEHMIHTYARPNGLISMKKSFIPANIEAFHKIYKSARPGPCGFKLTKLKKKISQKSVFIKSPKNAKSKPKISQQKDQEVVNAYYEPFLTYLWKKKQKVSAQ